jgi:hypothetical protein
MREAPNDGSGLELLGRITVALAVVGALSALGLSLYVLWRVFA